MKDIPSLDENDPPVRRITLVRITIGNGDVVLARVIAESGSDAQLIDSLRRKVALLNGASAATSEK